MSECYLSDQADADGALASYDFDLPENLIAQRPAASRDAARLLVASSSGDLTHARFSDLADFLCPGDLLVRNDTRVFPARIHGTRSGGGKTEFLLVYSLTTSEVPDATVISPEIMQSQTGCRWVVLAKTVHLQEGKVVRFSDELTATVLQRLGGGRLVVEFSSNNDVELLKRLETLGEVPLPPYIKRESDGPDADDTQRYQTIYAKSAGAVAAPTAGLHFTPAVEDAVAKKGIKLAHVTLHVGPGTFRPIIAERLDDHRMDAEYYEISSETAEKVRKTKEQGGRVITVGTTSTRALEASAQKTGQVEAGQGWTRIFIRPGYRFRAIDGLITNFHLPCSSLLVMISALMGRERVMSIYREAIAQQYRFYSYGDATLLLP